jgi:hypothetical protein
MWQSLAGLKEVKAIPVSEGATSIKDHVDKSIVTEHHIEPVSAETIQRSHDYPMETDGSNDEDQTTISSNEDDRSQQSENNVSNQQQQEGTIVRTRTRVIRRPQRLIEVAYSSYYESMHEEDYKLQDMLQDPISFLSKHGDPDTMYFHQAMRQPDREEFIKAIV